MQIVSKNLKYVKFLTGLIFANSEQQYTIKNFTYFNFLDSIFIIYFMRQMIKFYVSHSCKHNLHVTLLETKDLILCIPWM